MKNFNNNDFISASLGQFILAQNTPVIEEWCKAQGSTLKKGLKVRGFYLMLIEKLLPVASEINETGSAEFCEYKFAKQNNIVVETTTNKHLCDLDETAVNKAIAKEVFISGTPSGLTVKELNVETSLLKNLITNPNSITQEVLDHNRLMHLPQPLETLNRKDTGWFSIDLSTNILNNSKSNSRLLLNTTKAYVVTSDLSDYFTQSIAIDAFEFEQ